MINLAILISCHPASSLQYRNDSDEQIWTSHGFSSLGNAKPNHERATTRPIFEDLSECQIVRNLLDSTDGKLTDL